MEKENNKINPNMAKRVREQERKFVIFEMYYKHGEHKITKIKSETKLRLFLSEKLQKYRDEGSDSELDVKKLKTSELINRAVKIGSYRKSNDGGWGIVSVVEGDILNNSGERVYHFGTRSWDCSDSESDYEEVVKVVEGGDKKDSGENDK